MVLNDYRLRSDFAFDTPELQILYQLLCQNGEVTSQDLSEQPEGGPARLVPHVRRRFTR